ncbi:MAG TPA: ATPase, T2SS/T4P/T4SS family [Candidatus Acidoferrum sp.]|nr:ATPase, T2SS/T4P/T4SS family [Candidatus Acidoferrum sp.]
MKPVVHELELKALQSLKGRFVGLTDEESKRELITRTVRGISPSVSEQDLNEIIADVNNLEPVGKYLVDQGVEDIMVNNTNSIFVYHSGQGNKKLEMKFDTIEKLSTFVEKLKLYATNEAANGNIYDVHMPTGSRANVVTSPLGYDVTIRNFKNNVLSIIDLINSAELDYQMAARLWVYVDGFGIRPANLLFGGMPASGKSTLLNAMFSFFRPETRIVTIEETYELNTGTQENCVNLETSTGLTLEDLVKNALRMRPDMIVIGEVRGEEANDMLTAMSIGKIAMCTIHGSSARDVVTRLQNAPMNVPMQVIPAIDAIVITGQVFEQKKPLRKIIQVSETSGIETQVLLADIYKFDYKTHRAAPILPSVTYRDIISKLIGVSPPDILEEERVRAMLLVEMNKRGIRDVKSINEMVKEYYDNPQATLTKVGLGHIKPVIEM